MAIQETSLVAPADGKTYTAAPATKDGELVLLLVDDISGTPYAGSEDGLVQLAPADVTVKAGTITRRGGLRARPGRRPRRDRRAALGARHPDRGGLVHAGRGASLAVELQPTLVYDPETDTFKSIETGTVYSDNGEGSYVSPAGEALEPGWKTYVGFANFKTILTDPLVREPFLRVFAWTFAYAFLSVLIQFAIGLFLAITLNKPDLKLSRLQRALLVLPFAVPAFLAVLVWRGPPERRVRRRQPGARDEHPVALRPDLGEGVVHPRERLARLPVLVPRLHRGAAGGPGGADRGGPRRRRRAAPGLPQA